MGNRLALPVTASRQPRKQRRSQAHRAQHRARKALAAHLSDELILKYNRRAVPVVVGDTVRVLRGQFRDHEERVTSVDTRDGRVVVEGVTILKSDGKKRARPIQPSNVVITKLNLTDKYRRRKLTETVPSAEKRKLEAEAEALAREQEAERAQAEAREEAKAEAAGKAVERAAEEEGAPEPPAPKAREEKEEKPPRKPPARKPAAKRPEEEEE